MLTSTHGLLSYQCVLTTNLFALLNNIRAINRIVKNSAVSERE